MNLQVADDEARARGVLAEMQMRISQGPHAALGIAESASAEQVRAAFLELTKQFHPARFGRMATDIAKLSNEVFLGIKGAHDQLVKILGSTGRVPAMRKSGPIPTEKTPAPQLTGPMPRASTGTQPPSPFARGSERAPSPPTTTQIPAKRTTQPIQVPAPSRPTPALGIPISRPSTPPQRPATPVRPTTPGNPSTIRYSGVQPMQVTQPLPRTTTPVVDEEAELAQAMNLLSAKNWSAARQVLHALAAKVPQSKQYRSLLCYTRGREAQSSGRVEEATLEYQRALQLDPDLAVAKQALGELQRRRW
jgi:hypothetical protein